MFHSIGNLFKYAWANLVAALGTTTLSILIFSFLIPVVIFSATLFIRWRVQRDTGNTLGHVVRSSLLSWQTIVPSTIYLVAWLVLLGWSLSKTAYKDHLTLLGRILTFAGENKTLRGANENKRGENKGVGNKERSD